MELLKYIIYLLGQLSVTVITVESFQPNCDSDKQFNNYCFSISYCNSEDCDSNECGRFPRNTKLVRVISAKIIPTCAFSNSRQLRHIVAANRYIEVIASHSFVNLDNVDTIDVSFNMIKQLHRDTFKNVSATSLDLSWNKLVYIQDGAFRGLHNLRHLNLSKNKLSTLPNKLMPLSLTELNLSFNMFGILLLTSNAKANLTNLDLSNNKLRHIAFNFDNALKRIDLSHNLLSSLGFLDLKHCDELIISSNRFSTFPKDLPLLLVNKVWLHPNPWKCDELHFLWAELQNSLITIQSDPRDTSPVCVASEEASSIFGRLVERLVKSCVVDEHCDENMMCKGNTCLDPCEENVCHPTADCKTISHHLECYCPETKKSDPREPNSPCIQTECFVKSDCHSPSRYCSERKCISSPHVDQGGISGLTGVAYSSSGSTDTNIDEIKGMWWINEIPKPFPTYRAVRVKSSL